MNGYTLPPAASLSNVVHAVGDDLPTSVKLWISFVVIAVITLCVGACAIKDYACRFMQRLIFIPILACIALFIAATAMTASSTPAPTSPPVDGMRNFLGALTGDVADKWRLAMGNRG